MILSSRIDVKINFTSKRKRRSTKQARLNDYSEANPRKSIIFDTRTNNGKGTSFTYFNFIRYTEGGGGKCNNTKEGRVIDGSLGIHRAFHFHDINRRSRRVARSRPVSTKGKVYIAYTGLYILVPH